MKETKRQNIQILAESCLPLSFIRVLAILCCAGAMIAIPAATAYAANGINPEIANCEEVRDEATLVQMEFCSAHIGCAMVLKIQNICAKTKTFLTNLFDKPFWSKKKSIDSSDVFDAAVPSAEDDDKFTEISELIKSKYKNQENKIIINGVYEDGSKWVYEGPMSNGERNGTGVLLTEKGTLLRGEFVNGKQVGMGDLFNDKIRKAGAMIDTKMDGFGVERWENGFRYEGEYKGGLVNGKGVATWKNGDRFEGENIRGMRNGQGTSTDADGNQYTGGWENNVQSGQGTATYANGGQYTGEWKNGIRSGQGTLTYADGAQYTGEWKNDNRSGQGTLTYADGGQYTGGWENGKRSGQGTLTYANGSRLEGVWRDGVSVSGTTINAEKGGSDAGQGASETIGALGQILGAFLQIQQNKSGRNQVQNEVQNRRTIDQRQNNVNKQVLPKNETSRLIHNPANEAKGCISFFKNTGRTTIQMKNNCSYTVAISWPQGLQNIPPGESRHSFLEESFVFFACRSGNARFGIHQTAEMKQRNEYICPDNW